jgi:hypothetical protein
MVLELDFWGLKSMLEVHRGQSPHDQINGGGQCGEIAGKATRLSHAKVRSSAQRYGIRMKPRLAGPDLLTISALYFHNPREAM